MCVADSSEINEVIPNDKFGFVIFACTSKPIKNLEASISGICSRRSCQKCTQYYQALGNNNWLDVDSISCMQLTINTTQMNTNCMFEKFILSSEVCGIS